jgi:trehalose/maltose transport system substrate-binding protein
MDAMHLHWGHTAAAQPRLSRWRRAALGVVLAAAAVAPAGAATLKIACSGLGRELDLCKGAAQAWAKQTGNTVEVVSTPNDQSARLGLYQQVLASGSDKIDVFQVDVAQVGLLASQLLDLKPYSKGAESGHFPAMVAASTVGGRLAAMPWFMDAGLLYYRKDLLEKYKQPVPRTWDELKTVAETIQAAERKAGNDRMWGYVWQGRAYEGLTCNALEWIASYGGGTIVDDRGQITVDNAAAAKALAMAASWVGTISPTAVLNYSEEESRGPFQAGHAVFMRNWPYAWAASQSADSPVKGKVGVAVLPQGSGEAARNASTLGGQELAVSKYSKEPALAASLVIYMTGAEQQKARAIDASYNPTIMSLYEDADIRRSNPFMSSLLRAFSSAVARPTSVTGTHYNQVSSEFYEHVHEVLSKGEKPETALAHIDARLHQLSRGGKWQ